MDRKKFLKNGILGLGSIISYQALMVSCSSDDNSGGPVSPNCENSPVETAGPFPLKSPAELVREHIIGDRNGIPLMITIKVLNSNNNCEPETGLTVDIWHCDANGNYSEYAGQIDGDFTNEDFLRGRQATNALGQVTFLSVYPGWYPGRAPHIHIEVLSTAGQSLLVTQIAFPEDVSQRVYDTANYKGIADTNNMQDTVFSDSLNQNLASVTGTINEGFTLIETLKVAV